MNKFLAFDLGASSGRGIVGTLDSGKLELREVHRFPNGPVLKDGSFTWDYPRLAAELKEGLKKALASDPEIEGIAIDTWGVDYVFFDTETHEMKRLPYNYRDERTVAAVEKVLRSTTLEALYRATGIQHMALNTLFQLVAHKTQHPEDLEHGVFLPIPDALAFALGGDFTAEYSHCSTTELLDPVSRDWHWALIDSLGLPRSIFPKIVPPCTVGGALSDEIAAELHCRKLPIYKVGSHDTASAVAAVPAPENADWAYLSAGTWALLGAEIDAPEISEDSRRESFTNEGGLDGKIRFLTNIMGSWLFQESRRVWNEAGKNLSFADMEKMALATPPCQSFINPNDATFAAPGDMPERIRDFCRRTGQRIPQSDGEVLRTIYDSLALYFAGKLATLARLRGVRYGAFNVVGGGTRDRLLMQLTSDAMDLPVIAGPVEATAVGNLLGQAIAAKQVGSLAAARRIVRASFEVSTYSPRAEMTALYREKAAAFAEVAGR
ncbi:MAG: rhamnulokinase [Victivallaceae bacterium]|nr:rhamnulokinase [Victivallaceae bacterium]